jgi:hypothetical protein
LPNSARLVFRRDGSVLGRLNGVWGWISPSGRVTETLAAMSRSLARAFDSVDGPFPQAYDEDHDILLSEDSSGRLVFCHTNADPFKLAVLSISEPRGLPSTQSRRVTFASVNRFKEGVLLSLDNGGLVIRRWKVPPLVSSNMQELAPDAVTDKTFGACPRGKYCSEDHKWMASVAPDGLLSIEGREPWSNLLPRHDPQTLTVSSRGDRVLAWFQDEIFYVERSGDTHRIPRNGIKYAVFGPGRDRITVISDRPTSTSDEAVTIFGHRSWETTGHPTLKPEWEAPCKGCYLFLHSADESGVVVYSRVWAHRFTENDGVLSKTIRSFSETDEVWPDVVSRFQEGPITGLHSDSLYNSEALTIEGSGQIINFGDAGPQGATLSESVLPFQWIHTWHLDLCGEHDRARPERSRDDWRSVMCNWVERSGVRVEAP